MSEINNEWYDELKNDWYSLHKHPIALLRSESKTKCRWIQQRLTPVPQKILDIGCGAGFISNELQKNPQFEVFGLDLSAPSLETAKKFDQTGKVKYVVGNAYELPFADESFDVITCLDFLEHVDDPQKVIAEASRCLKPQGKFFFHTFNRNLISYLVAIKGVEWFVPNTPKDMHILKLFIKPSEIKNWLYQNKLTLIEMSGLKPRLFSRAFIHLLRSGEVREDFEFEVSKSMLISYIGCALKAVR